ncbi:MAG: FtsX-like permease family protein [Dehalococcoidia bacterium]
MVIRRSLANRRLLATVVVGVVMSAALMSSVILYSDAIRDLGLRYALRTSDPVERNVRIVASGRPSVPEYDRRRETIDSTLDRKIGGNLDDVVHYGRSATFYLAAPGEPVPEDENRPRAHFQFVDDFDKQVSLVEGRQPAAPTGDAPPHIEVLLGKEAAGELGVSLGDTFELHPFWRQDLPPVPVTVVGFVEPKDYSDPFWFGKTDRFTYPKGNWVTYPFWVPEDVMNKTIAGYLTDMDSTIETYGLVAIGTIDARNARHVEDETNALAVEVREQVSGATVETQLPEIIATYRTKLFFTRLPLFALMLQVVGIALYYLVMVATMLIERQSGEIALLRSRGASPAQVITIYAIEGLILCGAAALAGPYIAKLGISVLGYTPPFEELSGNSAIDVPISRLAFLAALGGAALAFAALMIPAWRAARQTTIDYKHALARPQTQPLFLRYYMDLVLVGIGAFLFYQLREKGSFVTEKLFGDLSADPLLLLSPTLFMLMVALVFLRIFPLALRFVAWATHRLDSPTVALGLNRMTRAPMQYSRLILLLLLATAVGMFAAGYRATLERGYDDRAAFESGSPSRLESIRQPQALPNDVMQERVAQATGSEKVSMAVRSIGSYNVSQYNQQSIVMLGVVPGEFEDVAYWRDDFAGPSLGSLLARTKPPESESPTGAVIPTGSQRIGLWIKFPLAPNVANLGIRLKDADGTYWEYNMFPATQGAITDWRFFVADLTRPNQLRFYQALRYSTLTEKTLDAVYVRMTGPSPQVAQRIQVLVDGIEVTDSTADDAKWTVIESFDSLAKYGLITGSSIGDPGTISAASGEGRDGGAAVRISFSRERGAATLFGLHVVRAPGPLLVLADDRFLSISGRKTGDEFTVFVNRQYLQVKLVGSFKLFPGFDPTRTESLLVTDRDSMQELASQVPALSDGAYANDAWMSPATPGIMNREDLLAKGIQADGLFDEVDIRASQDADPLIAASWEGILFLSFGAVLLLTGLGFAVYATLAVQSRSLEFAILRTMGYTNRQVLGLVSFEQLFVIVAGVAVGTFLGFPLGRLMIGYLGVTEEGADPVPPLVSQVSWSAVLTVYSLLAVVFIGTIASLAAVYSRLAVHKALRIGEV